LLVSVLDCCGLEVELMLIAVEELGEVRVDSLFSVAFENEFGVQGSGSIETVRDFGACHTETVELACYDSILATSCEFRFWVRVFVSLQPLGFQTDPLVVEL